MINTQKMEPQALRKDGMIEVVHVWKTIQGEGPFAGKPAVFVRTAGCNIYCRFCDTDYTSNRRWTHPRVLSRVIKEKAGTADLVVLSGGEPFRQNIWPLIQDLAQLDFKVQIETNGTTWVEPPRHLQYLKGRTTIVCSPKVEHLNSEVLPHIDAWKYVIDASCISAKDGLPLLALGGPHEPSRPPKGTPNTIIYVQPLDVGDPEKNKINTTATITSSLKYGYMMGVQLHKLLDLE